MSRAAAADRHSPPPEPRRAAPPLRPSRHPNLSSALSPRDAELLVQPRTRPASPRPAWVRPPPWPPPTSAPRPSASALVRPRSRGGRRSVFAAGGALYAACPVLRRGRAHAAILPPSRRRSGRLGGTPATRGLRRHKRLRRSRAASPPRRCLRRLRRRGRPPHRPPRCKGRCRFSPRRPLLVEPHATTPRRLRAGHVARQDWNGDDPRCVACLSRAA